MRAGGAGMWCCIGVGWSLIVQGNTDACDLTQVLWEGPEAMPLRISERTHISCAVAHRRHLWDACWCQEERKGSGPT